MKRTRFYQDPDDPAAFGGRGTGPRPRRDHGRGGGWRRAHADDSVDSEGEEGAQPTPGARARAPDRPPSPSRPVVRGLARCSVALRRREHEPVPSRRRALAAHRTARALTRVSRAPHQAKRWAHQPSPTRERSPSDGGRGGDGSPRGRDDAGGDGRERAPWESDSGSEEGSGGGSQQAILVNLLVNAVKQCLLHTNLGRGGGWSRRPAHMSSRLERTQLLGDSGSEEGERLPSRARCNGPRKGITRTTS